VPEELILGPLLIILCVNNVRTYLFKIIALILFADDIIFYSNEGKNGLVVLNLDLEI